MTGTSGGRIVVYRSFESNTTCPDLTFVGSFDTFQIEGDLVTRFGPGRVSVTWSNSGSPDTFTTNFIVTGSVQFRGKVRGFAVAGWV